MTDVTYVPTQPFKVGEYDGDDILLFGHYKVRLDDGMTALLPHAGFRHTVSADPMPVDDPGVREHLVVAAERLREARPR